MRWPDLRHVFKAIPWAVVGAVATRLYMPERATLDLGVMVPGEELAEAEARLEAAGWERVGALAVGGSSWRSPEGDQVDVLTCEEAWCEQALREAQHNREADGSPVIPLPYLVVLKLHSSRVTDVGDLARMLGLANEEALALVRRVVGKYAPQDVDDLEALIELGKRETRRRPTVS